LPLARSALFSALFLACDRRGPQEERQSGWPLIATSATFNSVAVPDHRLRWPSKPRFLVSVKKRPWLLGLTYKMGVDGISILFGDADDLPMRW